MNKYDTHHVTTAHPHMSREEWEKAYSRAWETYYSTEHIETVLKRAVATKTSPGKALFYLVWFKGCIDIEKVHPLEGGFLRLKFSRDRRSGLPLESSWLFYPKFLVETLWKQLRWGLLYLRQWLSLYKITRDSRRFEYTDFALMPVSDDETEIRELFRTKAARTYVDRRRRIVKIPTG